MLRRTIGVVLLLAMLGTVAWADAETNSAIDARSYLIMDADTGKVLLSHNPNLKHPPASTLKVSTALIALNALDLDDYVPVSRYAAAAPRSKIYIKPGEVYTVQEMLYAVLLSSGNDASRAIAERVCGTESRFAKYMTKRVREWGAYRTRYENASGLPAEDQYSTVSDLALIFRRAMANPTIAQIMHTKTQMIKGGRKLRNHNRFLFTIPYAVGGKTGYTRASQHTYVGMFEYQGRRIIIAVMGSRGKYKWADRRVLIEKGFELCGTPIAKLLPQEEKLRFTRPRYRGSYAKSRSKRKLLRRKYRKKRAKKKKLVRRKHRKKVSKRYVRGQHRKKSASKLTRRRHRKTTTASVISLKKKQVRRSQPSKRRAQAQKQKKPSRTHKKTAARIKHAHGG